MIVGMLSEVQDHTSCAQRPGLPLDRETLSCEKFLADQLVKDHAFGIEEHCIPSE